MAVTRSGFCALVGRPNVGKSTLLNCIIGYKVAITSPRPQTTRRRVIGVRTRGSTQTMFVDTPGMHAPKTQLGEFMVRTAREETRSADVICWLVDASEPPTAEDRELADWLRSVRQPETPILLVANKVDEVKDAAVLEGRIQEFQALLDVSETFQTAAIAGRGVNELIRAIEGKMPEGPAFYPEDQVTDLDEKEMVREVVREKALDLLRQEVPHSIAVEVEEYRPGEKKGTLYVRATLLVEKESQKPIVLGKGGARIKTIGQRARKELEERFRKPVFLDLWVKPRPQWRDRPDILKSLGYW